MADNLGVPGGSSGPAATDEIAGAHYQRIKLIHGADGVNAGDVSTANRYPVETTSSSVVGGGTEATALRVTIANNSTGLVSIDDNGSTISIDDGGGSLTTDSLAEGATADAAIVTDTTGSISGKLRGLVKHAFERMPAALGQATMANSLPVVIASNQSSIPVNASIAGSYYAARRTGANVGATTASYTAGLSIGDLQEVADVSATKAAHLVSVTVYYGPGTAADMDIVIFGSNPTLSGFVDAVTATIHDDDIDKVTERIRISSSDFVACGGVNIASKEANRIIQSSGGSVFVGLIARGAFTPDADTLGYILGVIPDA